MKKLICFAVILSLLAASFAGCGAKTENSISADTTPQPEATAAAVPTPEPTPEPAPEDPRFPKVTEGTEIEWTDETLKKIIYGALGRDLSETLYTKDVCQIRELFILSDKVVLINESPFWNMDPDSPGVYTFRDVTYTESVDISFDDLRYFYNLENLMVCMCKVKDIDVLPHLEKLKYLTMSGCGIDDVSPLAECDNLREVTMHDNNISDLSPLKDMELWDLFMSHNDISDISPLADMKKLPSEIVLSYNSITDISALAPEGRSDALAYLNLRNNNISDLSPLGGYKHIGMLSLTYNNISDVSPLKDMDKSITIYLKGNPVHNLSELAGFERIYADG
ncbi:MAG: leucine-rich repeat domain-containing protein [Ruminococcaceae bacterium]|nr:leucine-rich repeat domain-containing protein [Oscillospiraceae bacterium]